MTIETPARRLALVIPEATRIVGRVVLDGKPVSYYGVIVAEETERGFPQIVHDKAGKFARDDVSPGTWTVSIAGPAFRKKIITGVVVTRGTLDLGDIVVDRGRTLSGYVTDERGTPHAGASVAVRTTGARGETSMNSVFAGDRTARTDANGRYEVVGLDPAQEMRIQATHAKGLSKKHVLPATATFDVVITRTGSIVGRIDHMATRQRIVRAELEGDTDEEYSGYVDAAGGFTIDAVPPGEYRVSVSGDNTLVPMRVTVRPNQAAQIVFVMPALPITLVVRVAGCGIVWLRALDETALGIEMCETGVARFKNVAAASYLLCVDQADCKPIDLPTGRREIVLTPDL